MPFRPRERWVTHHGSMRFLGSKHESVTPSRFAKAHATPARSPISITVGCIRTLACAKNDVEMQRPTVNMFSMASLVRQR